MRIILSIIITGLVFYLNTNSFPQSDLKLKEGMKAPNFIIQNYSGKHFKLSSFKNKSVVVLYFYPKAGTPGCTKQACGIRDDLKTFKEKDIVVLGISVDSKKEIKKFADEHNLNFPLLSDVNKLVSKKYGVLREDGKSKRFTFVINRDGVIARIIEVKDVSSHAKEVYEIASQL